MSSVRRLRYLSAIGWHNKVYDLRKHNRSGALMRNDRRKQLARFKRQLEKGPKAESVLNCLPLKLENDGCTQDGAHRLHAIAQSGKMLEFECEFGRNSVTTKEPTVRHVEKRGGRVCFQNRSLTKTACRLESHVSVPS
jgi:hypothetical protein